MLSFAEEMYLLSLDEETGKFCSPFKLTSLDASLAAAVICELAFMNKLDSDAKNIYMMDHELTDSPSLNYAMLELVKASEGKPNREVELGTAFKRLLNIGEELERLTLESLVAKKILKKDDKKILWLIPSRRYPIIDDKEVIDVERRIVNLVTNEDEVPDPRDAVLVGLIASCGIFSEILSPRQLKRYRERILSIAKLDIVVQKTRSIILEAEQDASFTPELFM